MKKAIYYRLVTLALAAVLICGVISAFIYAVYTENQTEQWLTRLTLSAAENYKYNPGAEALSESTGGCRVTIIAPDGAVLDDSESDASGMDNHAQREEVEYARQGGVYIAMRTSDTLGEKFMYASIVTGDGNILRLAHSYSGLLQNLAAELPAVLAAVLAALILSLILAGRFTKAVTAPLEKVVDTLSAHDYARLRELKSPYYEMDRIMHSLRELLHSISDSNAKLRDERDKVELILSNMAEGFVLIDYEKNILLCNNTAREFFSGGGKLRLDSIYGLTRNQNILNAVQSALDDKQSSMFDLQLREELIVNIYISPSKTGESEYGATMLIVDMTSQKQLEQQKRDFFSNASHELKTPVTSILGFSEMLNKNMVSDESEKKDIMARIEAEAKRLSEIIADILTISKLESHGTVTEYADFNFAEVIKEAVSAVSPVKDGATVEINMELEDIAYRANKRQIYELCVNLIENAVKYNKAGGRVGISLKRSGDEIILSIRDTGIGIPPEYQGRIFERFFRVDYGRDKKVGGTGLGLSIVKHIVSIYGGRIKLQSEKDIGTAIEVFLPSFFKR